MKLYSHSFGHQAAIPDRYAYGKPDVNAHIALSDNINPHLAWSDAPAGTQSFAVLVHDPDVPSQPDDVNQVDREIPESLPRIDFYHWVLIDIAATVNDIAEGAYSQGVTPRGKAGPTALNQTRQGLNDYTNWFANDHDMRGDYFGYDGPCPPWNDTIAHRYVFTVYALDIAHLPLEGRFTGADVLAAMQGHILDQAQMVGMYTLNPRLR